MTKAIVFFLLVTSIGSCSRSKDPINRINSKLKVNGKEGFQKDIPEVYKDSSPAWYYLDRETKRAGLSSIENGSQSFEIRVWEYLNWGRMVFVIKYQDSIWSAKSHIYRLLSKVSEDIDSIALDIVRLGKPKTGWNKFMNKLIDKGILDLKDDSKIPGYFVRSEFSYVGVEIATKNYYKLYSLPNARVLTSKIKEDKAMLEILDLIEDEFPDLMSAISGYSKTGVNK